MDDKLNQQLVITSASSRMLLSLEGVEYFPEAVPIHRDVLLLCPGRDQVSPLISHEVFLENEPEDLLDVLEDIWEILN